jgi:hypothetical protein
MVVSSEVVGDNSDKTSARNFRRQSIRPNTKTTNVAKHPRMGPTHSQQQSICMLGGPKHWRQHPPKHKDHRHGKASTNGADTFAAARHLHARWPKQRRSNCPSNKTINTAKASANGANTLLVAKHLYERGPKRRLRL